LVDRSAFLKLLAKDFYPVLRAQGFKGSGTSLRRADGLFHHIVHIQGSLSARGCYVNLGAHLEFLPNEGGNVFSPKDFDEPSCSFRDRLDPPSSDQRWAYGASEAEAKLSIQGIIKAWNEQGREYFSRFSTQRETENLEHLIEEHGRPKAHPTFNLIAAHIALHLGDQQRAFRIATSALERVGPQAGGLRLKIKEFIGSLPGSERTGGS
jgi:hypothetical protein